MRSSSSVWFWTVLIMFLGCGLQTANTRAGQPINWEGIRMDAENTEWKREGPTVWLGGLGESPKWARVEAPTDLVISASSILGGEPSEWRVSNFSEYGKQIVCLKGAQGRHLIYLVLPDKWVLLNQPRSLPYVNYVLDSFFSSPSELKDLSKLAVYVQEVAYLFKGPQRVTLSADFLKGLERPYVAGESDRPLMMWLRGKEKDPDALRSLCADPLVKRQHDDIEIQCNVITTSGSVEKWTLKGKLEKGIMLTNIEIKQIREEGTFFFAKVPND